MTTPKLKDFMEKVGLQYELMTEIDLKKVYMYLIYPKSYIRSTNNGFLNLDNGNMGVTNWTCFYIKILSHSEFIFFGGQCDKF